MGLDTGHSVFRISACSDKQTSQKTCDPDFVGKKEKEKEKEQNRKKQTVDDKLKIWVKRKKDKGHYQGVECFVYDLRITLFLSRWSWMTHLLRSCSS